MTALKIITQAQAEALGLKRYYTGALCLHGHRAERYVRGRGCVECHHVPRTVVGKRESNRPPRPSRAAPVEADPVSIEQRSPTWRDPGTRVSQDRIDACIERIFNAAPQADVSEAA